MDLYKMISENIVIVISNIIYCAMWCAVMDILLEHKHKYYINILVHILFCITFFSLYLLPFKSILRLIVILISMLLQMAVLYNDKWLRKILVIVVELMSMAIGEILVVALFFTPEAVEYGINLLPISTQIQNYTIYLFINAVILGTATLFLLKSDQYGEFSSSYRVVVILLFIIEFLLLYFWTKGINQVDTFKTGFLVIVVVICMFGDMAIIIALNGIRKRSQLRAENLALESIVKVQEEHYAALADQYENIRTMRHDIANHMYTMHILLDEGKTSEAAEYAKELGEKNEYKSSLGSCHNYVVDAYLFHRIEELRASGIECTFQVNLPQHTDITNIDLISIFGNLLDNAYEACSTIDQPFIDILAELRRQYLYIQVKNSVSNCPVGKKKRRIPELARGVGSNILARIADKYNGEYRFETVNNIYTATIIVEEKTVSK